MTDFQQGIVVGVGVVLYLLLTIGPQVSTYLRRRRVLADAERRLTAAEAKLSGRGHWPPAPHAPPRPPARLDRCALIDNGPRIDPGKERAADYAMRRSGFKAPEDVQ